jgi:hypothetical protein
VMISRLGDLSALVDAYIAKPSSHWLSHSSMAAGVSGPAKGAMIFDAIKRRSVAGGGRVTEGGGEGRIVRGAHRRGTYGRGGAPKNGGRTSFSDSSPEESSGVLGVGRCGLLWRGTTSKGPKKGRGFAAVDCLVKRGGGVFSRVPAVGLECYRGQMSKKKWKPPVNRGSLFAVTQIDRTTVYSPEREATARGGYRLSGYI